MSRRSEHKVNQRVREGVESKRRVQLHVIQRQTEKIADLVAGSIKTIVNEAVRDELDRRGYTDYPDCRQTPEVSQEPDGQSSSETPEPVEEAVKKYHCRYCGYLGETAIHEVCCHIAIGI